MKYLFFDIECANCLDGIYKICEFGYVLTDEHFNVIKHVDIPISPRDNKTKHCNIDTFVSDKVPGYKRAYEPNHYYSCPRFDEYYQTIKELIIDKDTLVFGYSVENEIRFLDSEFKRYKLEPIKYDIYDVQIISKHYFENREDLKGFALERIFKVLCGDEEAKKLTPHFSKDDAFMTMRILKEIVKNLGDAVEQIITKYPDCLYDSIAFIESCVIRKAKKALMEKLNDRWKNFFNPYLPLIDKEESNGRKCGISTFIKSDEVLFDMAIKYIKENDLIPCSRISIMDFIIVADENDKEKIQTKPFGGQFIVLNEVKGSQSNT